jgi:hypothetical protein
VKTSIEKEIRDGEQLKFSGIGGEERMAGLDKRAILDIGVGALSARGHNTVPQLHQRLHISLSFLNIQSKIIDEKPFDPILET